jgi:hypothetical protein
MDGQAGGRLSGREGVNAVRDLCRGVCRKAVRLTKLLPPIFRAISAATKNHDHRIQRLQLRELAMFPGVIRKLVIWEESSWNNVAPHIRGKRSILRCQLSRYLLRLMCGGPR